MINLKLPRDKNRACKLNEEDIKTVFRMRSNGLTLKEIGIHFNVSQQAIFYILKSDEEKKIINKKRHLNDTEEDRKKMNIASRNAFLYKKSIMPNEIKKYRNNIQKEFREKNPEYNKKAMKKFYYKEKIGDRWSGAIIREKYRLK